MHHWLMKTEPTSFSVEDLAAAPRRTTSWDGVRNYQARNILRDQMRRGDEAFLYYSSTEVPGIVAIMQIVKEGYPDPTAFVAPCDGSWGEAGRIADGQLLQVKGRPYSLAALLGDEAAAKSFERGWFATCYLAPRDYHRFHAPCDGLVARAVHLPGSLWPVNRIGLEGVPGLFAENERICAFVRLRGDAREALALIAVGATMVGKVHVDFDALSTNTGDRTPRWRHYANPPRLVKGGEWGRFEFGSTLVLAAAPGVLELAPRPPRSPLRLGERIGTLA